ncbi:MAG: hypothetical protein QG608_1916 [Actinomycetota bacterium]|nr:hypothetical protein [Actinomycetota bacterium]
MRRTWTRWLLTVVPTVFLFSGVAALAPGAVALGAPGAGASRGEPGEVYVVHGVMGAKADVLVDDRTVAVAASSRKIVGPLSLAPGSHVLTLRDATETITAARFTVPAGDSIDVVAHRRSDSTRAPAVTVFANDRSAVGEGKARLVVSHLAVAPPSDIRVNGKPVFRNVVNGESLSLVLPARTYTVDIMPTVGTGQPVLDPVRIDLKAGTLTRLFAVGDPAARTVDAVVQELPLPRGLAAVPEKVSTGDGGQAAVDAVRLGGTDNSTLSLSLAVAALLFAWALVGGRCGTAAIAWLRDRT